MIHPILHGDQRQVRKGTKLAKSKRVHCLKINFQKDLSIHNTLNFIFRKKKFTTLEFWLMVWPQTSVMAKQNSWYDYELDSFEKYFQACKYTILTVIIQIFDLVFCMCECSMYYMEKKEVKIALSLLHNRHATKIWW